MSSRAEARRKAILARGSDRLSKLTSSARPDDPVYAPEDPPLPSIVPDLQSATTASPPRPRVPSNPSPYQGQDLSAFPSPWSSQQQQQLLAAMMGATPPPETPRRSPAPGMTGMGDEIDEKALAAALAQNPFFAAQQQQTAASKPAGPPSVISKFMPLVHLVCMWGLLGYFAFWMYPVSSGIEGDWRELANRFAVLSEQSGYDSPLGSQYGAAIMPFFWTFAAVQLALHSSRIVLGYDAIELPTVLSLALPALPPAISSIITNGLKYLKLISVFLDDVSVLLVGVAFIIYASTWLVN